MDEEIEKIFISSAKAELLEALSQELQSSDKAVVITVEHKDDGKYTLRVMLLGMERTYEALGIIEVGKLDILTDLETSS